MHDSQDSQKTLLQRTFPLHVPTGHHSCSALATAVITIPAQPYAAIVSAPPDLGRFQAVRTNKAGQPTSAQSPPLSRISLPLTHNSLSHIHRRSSSISTLAQTGYELFKLARFHNDDSPTHPQSHSLIIPIITDDIKPEA